MKKYTTLLFDLDDTLLDFGIAEDQAFRQLMTDNGLPFTQSIFDRYNEINRSVWKQLEDHSLTSDQVKFRRFEIFCQEFKISISSEKLALEYLVNLSKGVQFIDGAWEILQRFRQDHTLILVTNGLSAVQTPRIQKSGLGSLFSAVIISEEAGVSKPSVAFFELAWKMAGKPEKDKMLVIGDSISSDIQGGINFGIDTCWYNPANAVPTLPVTYNIQRLGQLPEIIA